MRSGVAEKGSSSTEGFGSEAGPDSGRDEKGNDAAAGKNPKLVITLTRLPSGFVRAEALGEMIEGVPSRAIEMLGGRLQELSQHLNRLPDILITPDGRNMRDTLSAIFGPPKPTIIEPTVGRHRYR